MDECVTLPGLPEDILVLILADLDAWDLLMCQQVSRAWHQSFSRIEFLRIILKKYPRSREVELLASSSGRSTDEDLKKILICVGHRYHNLEHGKPRKIQKYKLHPLNQYDHWRPIGEWDYHSSQPGGRLYSRHAASHLREVGNKPYLFQATLWSYDDGLVVCVPASTNKSHTKDASDTLVAVVDLASGTTSPIGFELEGKLIRNLILRRRVLVVEWAESKPFHALNDSDEVHRHFATSYDIERLENGACSITFRNQWKLHFLGLPLNSQDRFFSVHNGRHYAIYFWQPNRSMYTGDEDMPIESLSVWDMSIPSSYLPSVDLAGRNRPPEHDRPHPIGVFTFRELEHLSIRQRSDVCFMTMEICSETRSLVFKENDCVAGQGYFDPAERLMNTTITTFPFDGIGPARRQEWPGDLPPYRGHNSMESAELEDSEAWFLPVMDVVDPTANVRFSLVETCFTGMSSENRLVVRLKSRDRWVTLGDALADEISPMGRIAGDERWLVGQNSSNELVVLKF